MSKPLSKPETPAEMRAEAQRREREAAHRSLIDAINQKPVSGPAFWPGGFWAKSGPGSYDRGGTWNN